MSGNDENVGGCCERCRGCLNCARNLPFCGEHLHSLLITIRDIHYCECCSCIFNTIDFYMIASAAIFGFFVFTACAWFEFSWHTAVCSTIYCIPMISGAVMSRCCPRGKCYIKRVKKGIAARHKIEVVEQSSGDLSDGAKPLELEDPNIVYQGPDGAPAPERRHPAEVNMADQPNEMADQPNESSNLGEPTSTSSDEPSQQVAVVESGSNLRRSSTDTSTPSTSTTPLE